MTTGQKCKNLYYDENSQNFLVEYSSGFIEEMSKIDYACGDIITERIGVISVEFNNLDRLINEVKSIVFLEPRSVYVLQSVSPNDVDEIYSIKQNPYLNLTGKGVLVGLVDTGIDYLNEEFLKEDGKTRVLEIWDQTIKDSKSNEVYIGEVFKEEDINKAINSYKNNGDPYSIVKSKDTNGHGTQMASIIGARGYNKNVKGIAPDCEFVVVKLSESASLKRILRENNLQDKVLYNSSEILAGIDFLKKYATKTGKPMIICLGVGTTEGSHDGNGLLSRYITDVATNVGIVFVAGTGNEGAANGHTSGYIRNSNDVKSIELKVSKIMKYLSFYIWVHRPNTVSINIVSPEGEESKYVPAKKKGSEEIKFVLSNTTLELYNFIPEFFTGHQAFVVVLRNIVPGVWRINLKGDYIVDGRYDIWLPPQEFLPEGTFFLEPDPYITLTIPSTARNVLTVAYYNNEKNSSISESGRGFNLNNLINPDVVTAGINILTTKPLGGESTFSGSSAATAITVGACCLLLQWGIIDKNDLKMNSIKVRAYLIYGAKRRREISYPSKELGYGMLDIFGTFKFIGGIYENYSRGEVIEENIRESFYEYYVGKLFVRLPQYFKGENHGKY